MAYSHSLADRIREAFVGRRGIAEKRMFGSLVFLLHGNLCVGIWNQSLIARIGVEQAAAAMKQPHVGEFDVTGKSMKGWVLVEPDGLETADQLSEWIRQSIDFVSTLPSK